MKEAERLMAEIVAKYELQEDGVLLIRLQASEIAGRVASELLKQVLVEMGKEEAVHCFLEMSEVSYIDSSGLGVIAELLREVNGKRGQMVLINCDKGLSEIVEVMGFYRKILKANSIENARLLLTKQE